MTDDQTYKAHPIDPTVNAADIIGDTTGKPGMTTNVIQTPKTVTVNPNPADPDQNPKTPQTLPDNVAKLAQDRATEPGQQDSDQSAVTATTHSQMGQTEGELDLDGEPDIHNSEFISPASPDELDEQSFAGSAPDPDASNDTLQNAQMMGQQMEEDSEHPQELDIARDINEAEEFVHK
jgi:hypothetical protein